MKRQHHPVHATRECSEGLLVNVCNCHTTGCCFKGFCEKADTHFHEKVTCEKCLEKLKEKK